MVPRQARVISELACQVRKSNHGHKKESKCVPELLRKHYHKTSKLVQKYNTQHVFYPSKSSILLGIQGLYQAWVQSSIVYVFIEFLKISEKERTWIAN